MYLPRGGRGEWVRGWVEGWSVVAVGEGEPNANPNSSLPCLNYYKS